MEILSRFRKKKTSPENIEPVAETLKNWQVLAAEVASLQKTEYVQKLKTTIKLQNGEEIVFPSGTMLEIVPEHDDQPKSISEKPLHWPTQVKIFIPETQQDTRGKLIESKKLMYYAEPGSQLIYDYTDPEYPKGKTITDTHNTSYKSVYALVHSCLTGESHSLPE